MPKKSSEIDCEEVWRHISYYLDGEVEPGLRATLASHFKDCADCRAVLDGTRNVVKLIGDGKTFEIPASVNNSLYKKLSEHIEARKRKAD